MAVIRLINSILPSAGGNSKNAQSTENCYFSRNAKKNILLNKTKYTLNVNHIMHFRLHNELFK